MAAYSAVTSLQGCPLPIKRSLLLLMHRAQRPLCITAGGFFPLSRESFVAGENIDVVMLLASLRRPLAAAAEDVSDLDYVLKILHWSGTMRHPHAGPWASRVYYLINALSMVVLLLFNCSQAVLLWRDGATDLERFTLTLSVFNTTAFFTIRLGHIALRESKFHRLALQVQRDFDQFLSADDLRLLRLRNRSMRRVLSAYQWSLVVTAFVYSTVPVNDNGLPFVLALPYDVTRPLAFAATWLFSVYIVFCVHIGTMAADSFSVTLILQLHNQLEVLGRNLRSLNDSLSQSKFSSSQTHSMKNMQFLEHANHDIHYQLQQSVLRHQAIIRNVELLEQCLGGMLLGQSLSIGTSFCLQLFQAAKRSKGVQELSKTCSYLLTAFSMLFVYCWFGDDLISESERLALSAYDAATSLQECPTSTKRSLMLLMLRAQRPLRITAGGFFALSRESFVAVLNASYSFFAILRNFKDD
ncbi:odorant receptor Or2-like [Schistocerca cancellata]|uniref:odorant receptor Or2-like n=1 Tax=Schistocerca cancellata TaxID=274614 RepID=UPI0021182343|nr:odorant receptor Or2-like [Schistocerca cancellata]